MEAAQAHMIWEVTQDTFNLSTKVASCADPAQKVCSMCKYINYSITQENKLLQKFGIC